VLAALVAGITVGVCPLADELVEMSADEVRAMALGALLGVGTVAAFETADSPDFASGYCDDNAVAEYFQLLCARVDEAFGFDVSAQVPAQPDARRVPVAV
jgi:hypothetical protein